MSNINASRQQALFNHSRGRLEEAATGYAAVLAENPADVEILYFSGMLEGQRSNFAQAVVLLRRALEIQPHLLDARVYLGHALFASGNPDASLSEFDVALALRPDNAEVLLAKAKSLLSVSRFLESKESSDKVVAIQPKNADAWVTRGLAMRSLGDSVGALQSFQKARAANPTVSDYHIHEGQTLLSMNLNQEARSAFDRAVQIDPNLYEGHIGRAVALLRLHNVVAATLSADKARQLQPTSAHAYFVIGCGQIELGHLEEALSLFDEAIKHDPNHAEALFARGEALQKLGRHDEAGEALNKAAALAPHFSMAVGALLLSRLENCDWHDFQKLCSSIEQKIVDGLPAVNPAVLMSVCEDESLLLRCAEITTKRFFPPASRGLARSKIRKTQKFRIGFLGGDFRDSLQGLTLAAVLERIDRNFFEVFAIDTGLPDESTTRSRIKDAVDRFLIVTEASDSDAANRVAALQLDVLINLGGFLGFARPGILAMRPSGLQVNMGFPGTSGADYIDYLVASPGTVGADSSKYFVEPLIYLQPAYPIVLPIPIAAFEGDVPTREAFGIARGTFVFGCFQSGLRITPKTFERWMEILRRVPESVLLMVSYSEKMVFNLKDSAAKASVDPERLVFAPPAAPALLLASHQIVDLFLDTAPWGSLDPLYSGSPVLTIAGDAMQGRIVSSVLKSLGVDDLISKDPTIFVEHAVDLSKNPVKLDTVRSKLKQAVFSEFMFSAQGAAAQLEGAIRYIVERSESGALPATKHLEL